MSLLAPLVAAAARGALAAATAAPIAIPPAAAVPVSSIDYFPTLLEVAGAPAAAGLDGESIVPVLKGGAALQRSAIYWHYPHYHPGSATPYSAIRDGDWNVVSLSN